MQNGKTMNKTDGGRIASGFELTGYEMQVFSNVVNFVSSVRDREYAPRAACFMDEYAKTRHFPLGDTAELLSQESDSGRDDHELAPEDLLAKEQRRERNRQRRRAVVDDVLRRSGYVPTPEELAAYEKRAAEIEAEMRQLREELGFRKELAAK